MKKKRVLTILICMMMVMTLFPGISASASAVTEELMVAIGTVLGTEKAEIHPGTADWGAMNLDFTGGFDSSVEGLTANVAGYDNTAGAMFGSSGSLYYSSPTKYTVPETGVSYWSPLNLGAWGFRFKLDANGWLITTATTGWENTISELSFAPTYISVSSKESAKQVEEYSCGTDWNDVLIICDGSSAYTVYMKKASDTAYTKVIEAVGAKNSNTSYNNKCWTTYGARFDAANTCIAYSACFQNPDDTGSEPENPGGEEPENPGGEEPENPGGEEPETPDPGTSEDAYDGTQGNIGAVLGEDALVIKEFQFAGDFDKTQTGVSSPTNATYSDVMGLTIPADNIWKYLPSSGYTPLSSKGMTFAVKAGEEDKIHLELSQPGNASQRAYLVVSRTGLTIYEGNGEGGFQGTTKLVDYVPGDDWNDYALCVNDVGGYNVYAKKAAEENWTKIAATTSYRPGGGATLGLSLYSEKGNSFIKYIDLYGTEEELPEDEGPKPGEQATLEEIIGGLAMTKEEVVFDNNFNGVESDAQFKNVATGEVEENQPVIGGNGLELAETSGKFFTWGSGSEKAWKPLGKTNPVMLRARVEAGAQLGVQLNGNPRASVYISPDKLIVWGTDQKQAEGFAPGTGWVNYLVTHTGTNFRVYTKLDGEEKWTMRISSNGFRTGGYYGVLLDNTTTSKAYVSEIRQYKVGRMVLTDANTIASMTNTVYFTEDFSEDPGTYSIITGKIENGVFMRDAEAEPNASYPNLSRIDVDMSAINPKGQWFIRFKYMLPDGDAIVPIDMQNNGAKIAIDAKVNGVTIFNRTSGYSMTSSDAAAGTNQWAELLFAWTDNSKVSVYWHKVGDDGWIKTHTDFVPGSSTKDDIQFHAGGSAQIDDIMIYAGDYLVLTEPELTTGTVKTGGEFFSGTLDTPYDRRATLIAAVYDKEYGYTKFVKAKDYEVRSGVGANLSNTFTAEDVDPEQDEVAVMFWDTITTGIPLGDMAGKALTNKASGAANGAVAVKAEVNYNEITITGNTGVRNGRVTISVSDENGVVRAAGQTTATATGLVDVNVAVDPSCPSGTYTVRVQYGTTIATETQVSLFCDDIPYNSITDVTSMRNFISNYGSETAKAWNVEESFAADVYARYLEAKGSTTTFASLYEFRKVMDAATEGEIRERELCKSVNEAAAASRWAEVQELLLNTYGVDLGLSISDIAGIRSEKELFLRMGSTYTSTEEILAGFRAAVAAQKLAESGSGTVIGGGAAGGGGAGGIAGNNKYDSNDTTVSGAVVGGGISQERVEKPEVFTDLASVPWAEDSIKALKNMGFISGNGDGTFAPDRAVTREEFLKMALQAAGISPENGSDVTFRDVDKDAWYYGYVATAYQAGIITGQSEEYFGIGQQITRADMAVIVKRILDYREIALERTVAPFVFADFDSIPQYARESIDALAQAELMNGVGDNQFAGDASATRAESAVAIYRIYNYMAERR